MARNQNNFMARKKQYGTLPTGSHRPRFKKKNTGPLMGGITRGHWLYKKRMRNADYLDCERTGDPAQAAFIRRFISLT